MIRPPDADDLLDARFPLGDGTADTEAPASCPHCGESVRLAVDPGGGARQRYVEDCPVCCRPWAVRVEWSGDGTASVHLEREVG
jgi:hypothetical protein